MRLLLRPLLLLLLCYCCYCYCYYLDSIAIADVNVLSLCGAVAALQHGSRFVLLNCLCVLRKASLFLIGTHNMHVLDARA